MPSREGGGLTVPPPRVMEQDRFMPYGDSTSDEDPSNILLNGDLLLPQALYNALAGSVRNNLVDRVSRSSRTRHHIWSWWNDASQASRTPAFIERMVDRERLLASIQNLASVEIINALTTRPRNRVLDGALRIRYRTDEHLESNPISHIITAYEAETGNDWYNAVDAQAEGVAIPQVEEPVNNLIGGRIKPLRVDHARRKAEGWKGKLEDSLKKMIEDTKSQPTRIFTYKGVSRTTKVLLGLLSDEQKQLLMSNFFSDYGEDSTVGKPYGWTKRLENYALGAWHRENGNYYPHRYKLSDMGPGLKSLLISRLMANNSSSDSAHHMRVFVMA